ncbi:MAG: sulfatase-like hydrolase/transferase [Gammaproteobacteria bacterium]|nr:sulfatase-like hydrolase/transferase [Gammaproteobacteria bacterium]
MKTLLAIIIAIALALAVAWGNRLDLLMWGVPILTDLTDPIGPNVPTAWQAGPETAARPPGERPPNIVLIFADDLGYNDVSFTNGGAGDGSVQTPHIDAIAHEGVTFANGYAANAICAPSRASILTGRYSTRFGFEFTPFPRIGATISEWMNETDAPLPTIIRHDLLDQLPDMSAMALPDGEVTIAEVLRAAGYYTAHIGKWHLGREPGQRPEDQGFDDSLYMAGAFYLPEDHPKVVNAMDEDSGIERMVWTMARYAAQWNGGPLFEPDGYLTDYYTDEAVKVIEANRHRPFFLYLSHWGIHNPLQALRSDYDALAHIEDHALRVYAGMILSMDRSVRRMEEALEAHGLAENTLVVFTSDNGGAGYIGLPDVNMPYRGWKLTHFEGGLHVPFAARWPARIAPGTVVDDPVHHFDLFTTFATAAGGRLPGDRVIDGVDLLPYARGEADGVPHETLFWRQGHQQTVLHQGWKMIRTDRPEKAWLFDLANDPTEQRDVAAALPERVAQLQALLAAHNARQAEPMWPSVLDVPQLIDKPTTEPYQEGDEYLYWPN